MKKRFHFINLLSPLKGNKIPELEFSKTNSFIISVARIRLCLYSHFYYLKAICKLFYSSVSEWIWLKTHCHDKHSILFSHLFTKAVTSKLPNRNSCSSINITCALTFIPVLVKWFQGREQRKRREGMKEKKEREREKRVTAVFSQLPLLI